jgi:integral membrane protein
MSLQDHLGAIHLRRLRIVAFIEGTTLLLLVGVAVPLKHLAGLPLAVSVIGPIHGLAFVSYLWMVFHSVSSHSWSGQEIGRLLVAALIPFGGLLTASLIHRKLLVLAALTPEKADSAS